MTTSRTNTHNPERRNSGHAHSHSQNNAYGHSQNNSHSHSQSNTRNRRRRKRNNRTSAIIAVALFLGILILSGLLLNMILKDTKSIKNDLTQNSTSASNETVTETEAEPVPVTIDLMMIGDVLAHTTVINSGLQADKTYNYDHLFANIKSDIQAADIAIVNQESIFGGKDLGYSTYPAFNSPQEIGDAEVNAGFNVILHATNHVLDKGTKAIDNCLNFWNTNHPDTAVLGINSSKDQYDNNIYVYTKDDFKVAILNYTYGTNGISLASGKEYYINLLDKDKITKDVKKAKELADMVVVCPHWGTEYTHTIDGRQREWTKLFLELGVDLVIGSHPHVIQTVETLNRADGHQMVVFYSLGNFVSTQSKIPRVLGGMAKVQLVKEPDGTSYINTYEMVPIVTHILTGNEKITSYKLSDYTNDLAKQNKIKDNADCSDFSVEYCDNLCTKILGKNYDSNKKSYFVQLHK